MMSSAYRESGKSEATSWLYTSQLVDKDYFNIKMDIPKVVGSYSQNCEKTYYRDNSGLKYFCYPQGELDLGLGYTGQCKTQPNDQKPDFHNLLKSILDHFPAMINPNCSPAKILDADFVCFRGVLTMIMLLPYARQNLTLNVVKWKGTIYIYLHDKFEYVNDDGKKFCYWGYKFENYTLSYEPNVKPDPSQGIDDGNELACIFKNRINDHTLIYGAEMDGILSDSTYDEKDMFANAKFVEVKTHKLLTTEHDDRSFRRYKLMRTWAQCYLAGVKKAMIGFRTSTGIVQKVRPFEVEEIPAHCKELWNNQKCIASLNGFLNHVKYVTRNISDNSNVMWQFFMDGREDKLFTSRVPIDLCIVPQWYKENLEVCHRQCTGTNLK